jgi:hypothetical protein
LLRQSGPLVLYSCNTWLSWAIAERYYQGIHYCWCAPFFDGRTAAQQYRLPPTASPAEISATLLAESSRGDRHSGSIERNRLGLRRGIQAKLKAGVISAREAAEIGIIVEDASLVDFRPLLYVIPFAAVAGIAAPVGPRARAHPLSPEYLIHTLPGHLFDVLELGR